VKRILLFFLILLLTIISFSSNNTFLTYTLSKNNQWKVTQDAYIVSEVLFGNLDLYYPQDMYIYNNKMYIADSGNARILVYDMKTKEYEEIGAWSLFTPSGVFVTDDYIYVADPGTSEVVIFDHYGEEVNRIGRPNSILFGKNNKFKPKKLVVDKRGNIYIVSEGSSDGIIQLDRNGEFLGFFGSNKTYMGFLDKVLDIFYSEEQKSKLLSRMPRPYNNLTIDKKGLVYTITRKSGGDAIKKHNTVGNNILYLSRKNSMIDEKNFVDIAVDNSGRIYALTETGLIYEYDSEGRLIFSFGGRAISSEMNGLISVATSISVDENNNLYVLDRDSGLVHVYTPTIYANLIHQALDYYVQGKYLESKDIWRNVLKYDGYINIAHNGIAKAYFQEKKYDLAAKHFKIAFNREGYSEAFWEIRNIFLQKYIPYILIVIILIYVVIEFKLIKFKKIKIKSRVLKDIFYLKNLLKHPIDSFYYLKKGTHGSILSATIIYLLFSLVVVLDYMGRSFIFNLNTSERSVFYVMFISLAPTILFVFANYLVSSINDGKGTLKNIYIFTAYSAAPYILLQPLVVLLSYGLSFNESFLIEFSSFFIISWTIIVLFLGIQETHHYSTGGTIKNILLSLLWILIIILIYSIVYMLWDQIFETIYSIVQEVLYHVR